MAYTRTQRARRTTRKRAARANGPDTAGIRAPILTLATLASLTLAWFMLPWAPLMCAAAAGTRAAARPAQLTGQDPWKRPAPATPAQRRADRAYRLRRSWYTHLSARLDPHGPQPCLYMGLGALTAIPVQTRWGAWAALAQMIGLVLLLAARPTPTVDGPVQCGPRPVTWARNRIPWITGATMLGLTAGAIIWTLGGSAWWTPALTLTAAPAPMWPAWRASRRQYKADKDMTARLNRWLTADGRPATDRPPARLDSTTSGAHGERTCRLTVPSAPAWTDKTVRDTLRAASARDGYDVGFVLCGADMMHVMLAVTPLDAPAPADILADKTALEAWCAVETARLCNNYNATGGRPRLTQVGTRDGKPACWIMRMDGGSADSDWDMIRRDWLRGSQAGQLGDWGCLCGLTMSVDPGLDHAWVFAADTGTDGIVFDEDKAKTGHTAAFSTMTDGNTPAYLALIEQERADMAVWDEALNGTKLEAPMQIIYDRRTGADRLTSRDGRWALECTPCSIPTKGGHSAADYMKTDLRAAFGDSTVADVIGLRNRGKWFTRYMQLVQTVPANNPAAPTRLADLSGDGPAERLMAQVIISRAIAGTLKHAAYVDAPRQCARDTSWTMWRAEIQLTGGDTAMDARRAAPRIATLLGADTTLWEIREAGMIILWAGNRPPDAPEKWRRGTDRDTVLRLRFDEAWAATGLTAPDGRTVATAHIGDDTGPLTRLEFTLPAGIDPAMCDARLDRFAAAAGYGYTRPTGAAAGRYAILAAATNPLPDRIGLDGRTAMSGDRRLAFAVRDDGTTVLFDPADDPHLLASGTTGSGKSSVSVTLIVQALRAGWQVLATDPEKGANDLKPLAPHMSAFDPSLEGCYAIFQWAHREMRRRVALIDEHGGGDWAMLPDPVRPPRLLVFCDEFNSLLQKDKTKISNENNDPDLANEETMRTWRNGLKSSIGMWVSALLTQGRSAGITVLLGAQALKAGDLELLPNAGTAKTMLARVFLGSGDASGNVSGANVKETNRLHRQATRCGGMPKGRGVYERLGRGVDMVQCLYPGQGDELERWGPFPQPQRIDLSPFMPAPPELTGLAEPDMTGSESVETVQVDAAGEEWTL
ncbi:FtsK/SpoIIIE domain-containing protein [Bifidobacterium castoris]|uniref:Cell division protein FtsK n=1 Tax=Bifidobacterium castoris TaxID=2306972 RepID=A0A430FAG9_9BIFI|nr:FtsK/SpoIIIE domain-containing protein [Bifidobacterium castoris]RSX49837.1 cell division protein FtsK [Bifidobacterium castoris]